MNANDSFDDRIGLDGKLIPDAIVPSLKEQVLAIAFSIHEWPCSRKGCIESIVKKGFDQSKVESEIDALDLDWQAITQYQTELELSYCNTRPFLPITKTLVIQSLLKDGYDKAHIDAALIALNPDWSAIILDAAKHYLKADGVSKTELIDRLCGDQYDPNLVVEAVGALKVNWPNQVKKSIDQFIKKSLGLNFDKSAIIAHLIEVKRFDFNIANEVVDKFFKELESKAADDLNDMIQRSKLTSSASSVACDLVNRGHPIEIAESVVAKADIDWKACAHARIMEIFDYESPLIKPHALIVLYNLGFEDNLSHEAVEIVSDKDWQLQLCQYIDELIDEKPKSRAMIVAHLIKQGVCFDSIEKALSALDIDWVAQAAEKAAVYLNKKEQGAWLSRHTIIKKLLECQFDMDSIIKALDSLDVDWDDRAVQIGLNHAQKNLVTPKQLIGYLYNRNQSQAQIMFAINKIWHKK